LFIGVQEYILRTKEAQATIKIKKLQ